MDLGGARVQDQRGPRGSTIHHGTKVYIMRRISLVVRSFVLNLSSYLSISSYQYNSKLYSIRLTSPLDCDLCEDTSVTLPSKNSQLHSFTIQLVTCLHNRLGE